MKRKLSIVLINMILVNLAPAATTLVVEPDNFADGAALTSVAPGMTLNTTDADGVIVPLFTVTADTRQGLASTGDKVFGHASVPFWWEHRRLRVDFDTPVQQVNIDVVGGTNFARDVGYLEAYDAQGNLLTTYVSQPLAVGDAETMTIARGSADISYVSAYSLKGPDPFGPFASLDNLAVVVPEPTCGVLFGMLLMGLAARRRGRSRGCCTAMSAR
jgi:hypothetical protein